MQFFLMLLLSFKVLASTNMELKIDSPEVQQGEIVSARLSFRADSEGVMPNLSLKDKKFANTVYFLSLKPFVGKEGQGYFEAEAKVIFIKIPVTAILVEKIGTSDISINLGSVNVKQTQSEGFKFSDFDIPRQINYFFTALGLFLLGVVIFFVRHLILKANRKKELQERRKKIKEELLQADNYDAVVELWKKKANFLSMFPIIEKDFHKLETVLFKYQFKANQAEHEKQVVLEAYQKFKEEIKVVLNGV